MESELNDSSDLVPVSQLLEETVSEGSQGKKRAREEEDETETLGDEDASTDDADEDDDSIVVPDELGVVVPEKLTEEEEENLMKEEAARVLAEGLAVRQSSTSRYPLRANIKKPKQDEYFEKLRLEAFLEDERKERISTMKSWWKKHKVLLVSKLGDKDHLMLKTNSVISASSIEDVRNQYYEYQDILVEEDLVDPTDDEESEEDEEEEDESFEDEEEEEEDEESEESDEESEE